MAYHMTSCGCLPGDRWNGWLEIRSSYCMSEENRLFTDAMKRVNDDFFKRIGKPNPRSAGYYFQRGYGGPGSEPGIR